MADPSIDQSSEFYTLREETVNLSFGSLDSPFAYPTISLSPSHRVRFLYISFRHLHFLLIMLPLFLEYQISAMTVLSMSKLAFRRGVVACITSGVIQVFLACIPFSN
jgi:hypothetical protein